MTLADRRALDHVIIAVQDLKDAGTSWEELGFRVLPRMPHLVSGSANRIIQFGANYLELLGELDALISPDHRRHYSGRFAFGEGLTNVCFSSTDLAADRAAVEAAGIAVGPIGSARRPVVMPDGRTEMTDTDYFYPRREARPYAAPFLAEHRRPETIFIAEYGDHPNSASGIVGVVHYSADSAQDAAFFARMSGGTAEAIEGGRRLRLAGDAAIELLDAPTLRGRYGAALPILDGRTDGYGVGLKIAVRSLAACRDAVAYAASETADGLLVPAGAASGCFLLFCARS